MRLSNNWSDTLYVESARGKDMIVVAIPVVSNCFWHVCNLVKEKMNQTNQKQFSSNRTHTRNLNQPKRVVSDVTVLSGLLCAVMSVCGHTCFASSANESFGALTLECPKDISTCAAILAWIAFTARTFVDVWEKKTQVDAWSVSLLWCIFIKGLIANLLSGKEATVVST